MKKVLAVFLIALFAAPVMAGVTVSCVQGKAGGQDVVYISYVYDSVGSRPRAFALDVSVDAGDPNAIVIGGYDPCTDPFFIYPGKIQISDGNVTGYGDPNADPCSLGENPDGITIEMGSLYKGEGNAPPDSNTLLWVQPAADCTVQITGNATRGGLVLEDGNTVDVNTSCAFQAKCFPSGHPDYQAWVDACEPPCWCDVRQCHGDVDNFAEKDKKGRYFYVGYNDLNTLVPGWLTFEPPDGPGIATISWNGIPGICADFGHDVEKDKKARVFHIGYNDLNILVGTWQDFEAPDGPGVEPNCMDYLNW